MNPELTLELLHHFIRTALLLSAPFLGTAILIGTGVSLLQSVTSIQEQTIPFVAKLFSVGVMFLIASPWLLRSLVEFTASLYNQFPLMAQ
ncbi:MAG: flagellar biosynthetic protein FliQ [Puniceicoccaceae bacterium]